MEKKQHHRAARKVVEFTKDHFIDKKKFQRIKIEIFKNYGRTFELLAAYDRGEWTPQDR